MKTQFSKPNIALLAIIMVVLTAVVSHAAVDMFLTFDDVKGKEVKVAIATDGTFKTPPLKAGVYSWSWGVNQACRSNKIEAIVVHHEIISPRDPASGQATGKRQYQPVIIRKRIDKTSPLLCKMGNLTVEADCEGMKGTVEFKDAADKTVMVSSWDLATQKK